MVFSYAIESVEVLNATLVATIPKFDHILTDERYLKCQVETLVDWGAAARL